jgi:hypothetical protein
VNNGGNPVTPAQAYARRLAQRRESARPLARRDAQIANARLFVFVSGLVVVWAAFEAKRISGWWLIAPILVFGALVLVHEQVIHRHRRITAGIAFYEAGLARLEDHWSGAGTPGANFLDEHHPYTADLDLFGRGSVFERLCTARTSGGEATLARWLCDPATAPTIHERQRAVAELAPLLDLREELALAGADIRSQVDGKALEAWAVAPPQLAFPWLPVVAAVLATATVATAISGWLSGNLRPLTAAVAAEGLLVLGVRRRVSRVIHSVDRPRSDLTLIAGMLALLERQKFRSPRLVELCSALDAHGLSASRQIDGLRRRVDLLDYRRNMIFGPVAALLLWGTQCAVRIEAWRRRHGPAVGKWLGVVGELEALVSLANYAYENPEDIFPEIVSQRPCFKAKALGHPLLPRTQCVPNDIELDLRTQALIVSGSNMSGRCQCGAGPGGRHGPGAGVAALSNSGGRLHSPPRLAPGGNIGLLRRDCPAAKNRRSHRRIAAAGFPARRDPARHQLPRPPVGRPSHRP